MLNLGVIYDNNGQILYHQVIKKLAVLFLLSKTRR